MKYVFFIIKIISISFKKYSRILLAAVGIILFMFIVNIFFGRSNKNSFDFFDIRSTDVNNKDDTVQIEGNDKAVVYINSKKKIEKMNVEDYITGVVAAEMPIAFNEEALRAQAVAARTYYYAKRINHCTEADGAEICTSVHCQVYMSKEERLKKWPKDKGEEYWKKAQDAVNSTKDQVITYNDEIITHPQFFAVSSGKTENAKDVFSEDIPYLKSIDSKGEEIAPKYKSEVKFSIDEFINIISKKHSDSGINKNNINESINILSSTDSGSVKEIKIGNTTLSGVEFRKLFNINSTNFKLSVDKNNVKIDCTGYGHGVGMSQWGAKVMADNGSNYEEIIKHYYSGVEIKKVKYE